MHVDHAGIATEDATEMAARYADLLDGQVAHEETLDGMDIVFLDLGNAYFELIEPLADDGPIAASLAEHGQGIHHLALATEGIEAALERAREQGIELIDEDPRPGAWGHDVAFLHPKSTGGVLLEFVQH